MISSKQEKEKETRSGSFTPIQNGSKGGLGSLNNRLRFSFILLFPFAQGGKNGDGRPICPQGSVQMSWRLRDGLWGQVSTSLIPGPASHPGEEGSGHGAF